MCKKFLLGAILTALVYMTACSKGGNDVTETSVTTASESVSAAEQTTVTEAKTEMQETEETSADTENNDQESIVSYKDVEKIMEYFSEHGFKNISIHEQITYHYDLCELAVDMNDYKDVSDPFEGLDENYLKNIHYITLLNVDGRDLSFISQFNIYYMGIAIKDYSGSTDFSPVITDNWGTIIFDNYMGGDLSTVYRYEINLKNYSGEYPLNGMDVCKSKYLYFDNYAEDVDFSFLSDYPNIKRVGFEGKSVNAEVLAEVLKNSGIDRMTIEVEDYSAADSDMLMKAAPTKDIRYYSDYSDRVHKNLESDDIVFYTDICVYQNILKCRFSNLTDKAKTANSVSIFKDGGVNSVPMTFIDGSTEHKLDLTINANENYDFYINEEIFDFSGCEAGAYRVVFDFDGKKLGQMFFIDNAHNNSGYYDNDNDSDAQYNISFDFLTDEQNEAFKKAYKIADSRFGTSIYLPSDYVEAHTVDEFLAPLCEVFTYDYAYKKSLGLYIDEETGQLKPADGDRGGIIYSNRVFFLPIYSDENEVLFKAVMMCSSDNSTVWFEEINYHMVKTDDGWRFDKFTVWNYE